LTAERCTPETFHLNEAFHCGWVIVQRDDAKPPTAPRFAEVPAMIGLHYALRRHALRASVRSEGETVIVELDPAIAAALADMLDTSRPGGITDEMLREAETHHGDSCSYCNSAGDIDCPTAAILDALNGPPPSASPLPDKQETDQ
jgi:hypothetical protein